MKRTIKLHRELGNIFPPSILPYTALPLSRYLLRVTYDRIKDFHCNHVKERFCGHPGFEPGQERFPSPAERFRLMPYSLTWRKTSSAMQNHLHPAFPDSGFWSLIFPVLTSLSNLYLPPTIFIASDLDIAMLFSLSAA